MNEPRLTSLDGESIFTIHDLFSAAECAELVRSAEGVGFDAAPITTSGGPQMMPEMRNNTRVMLDDLPRARSLWERLEPWVPARLLEYRAVGLNERFRFYRYGVRQYFRWHYDGAFVRDRHERSMLTAMIYLNDGFDGGTTDFDLPGKSITVTPERGMALLFEHRVRHQGAPIVSGVKYVLRTDVMYRRGPLGTAPGARTGSSPPGR